MLTKSLIYDKRNYLLKYMKVNLKINGINL